MWVSLHDLFVSLVERQQLEDWLHANAIIHRQNGSFINDGLIEFLMVDRSRWDFLRNEEMRNLLFLKNKGE